MLVWMMEVLSDGLRNTMQPSVLICAQWHLEQGMFPCKQTNPVLQTEWTYPMQCTSLILYVYISTCCDCYVDQDLTPVFGHYSVVGQANNTGGGPVVLAAISPHYTCTAQCLPIITYYNLCYIHKSVLRPGPMQGGRGGYKYSHLSSYEHLCAYSFG